MSVGTGSGGGVNFGGMSWSSLQNELNSAKASGDPTQLLAAQQDLDHFFQMVSMVSNIEKTIHDMMMSVIGNLKN